MSSNPYDYKPISNDSNVFIRLKAKGDKVKLRLASEPYRRLKIWREDESKYVSSQTISDLTEAQLDAMLRNPDFVVSEVFVWKAIDRTDGKAKITPALPTSVFNKISAFAKDEDWGNPTGYDITIERTENPGANYWSITPSPNKTPLTDDEKAAAGALDLAKLDPAAKSLNDTTALLMPHRRPPQPKEDEVVAEDIDDKPIDLSEIPY